MLVGARAGGLWGASDEHGTLGAHNHGGRGAPGASRHTSRAVLRPRLRLRPYPGDRLPRRPPHVDRDVAGRRSARGAVVGVGRIRVADQRRAGRGGNPRAARDPRRDGGRAGGAAGGRRRRRGARARRCAVRLATALPAAEVIPVRLVILVAMAAMLVASLAVPDAFGEYGALFGFAYFVVRLLHVVLFVLATGNTPETRQAMLRLAPGFLAAPAFPIPAGFVDGFAQGALWAAAIGIDLSVSMVRGVSGFRVQAGHFVERFGLIIIIALGESIVSIGVGASGLALGTGVVLAAVLGVALAAALWWAYFDLVVLVAERRLSAAKGDERGGARGAGRPYLA